MPALCSWSGGKDSCLALYRTLSSHIEVTTLLTMLSESGERSRSHGIARRVLEAQAAALGKEIVFGSATWGGYEAEFINQLQSLKERGLREAVFGDIDLESHREWEEKVSARSGLKAILPLWGVERRTLIDEFLKAGFRAVIVSVRGETLSHWLGREFCEEFVAEAERMGWDACGEEGEFHTFVFDGPIFKEKVRFKLGDRYHIQNYVLISLELAAAS